MQVRIGGGVVLRHRLAKSRRTLGQALPHRPHVALIPHERRAGAGFACRVVRLVRQVRMQHQRRTGVGEEAPVPGVEVAFRRQALGEQDRMAVQLDVEVFNRGPAGLLQVAENVPVNLYFFRIGSAFVKLSS